MKKSLVTHTLLLCLIGIPHFSFGLIIERNIIRVGEEYMPYTQFLEIYESLHNEDNTKEDMQDSNESPLPEGDMIDIKEEDTKDINRQSKKTARTKQRKLISTMIQGMTVLDFAKAQGTIVRTQEIDQIIHRQMKESGLTVMEFEEKMKKDHNTQSMPLIRWNLRIFQTRDILLRKIQQNPLFSIKTVSQSDIKDCYENIYLKDMGSEVRHINHLIVRLDSENPFSPEAQKARTKIDEAYSKFKSGTSFAELTKTYSEDKLSSDNSGFIGGMTRRALNIYGNNHGLAYGDIAFRMKAGEISKILKGKNALHIIHLAKVIEGKKTTIKEAEQPCYFHIKSQRYIDILENELRKHRSQTPIDVSI